jgi:hypothetical protein
MADPYYTELLGGSSTIMGESHGEFYNNGMAPNSGGGGGSIGGIGNGMFGFPPPRLLTGEDSAVCLRMTVRRTYVSHSTREERHGRPGGCHSVFVCLRVCLSVYLSVLLSQQSIQAHHVSSTSHHTLFYVLHKHKQTPGQTSCTLSLSLLIPIKQQQQQQHLFKHLLEYVMTRPTKSI